MLTSYYLYSVLKFIYNKKYHIYLLLSGHEAENGSAEHLLCGVTYS